jgi:branched-chain amino acid transport system substrate-binding protein
MISAIWAVLRKRIRKGGWGVERRLSKYVLLVIGLAVVGILLPILREDALGAQAKEPVLVGISASLSGRFKSAGTSLFNGYRTWAEFVNRRGGLLGRPVKLVYYDDQSDVATAVRLYRKLVTEDRVHFLFGPYGSPATYAVSEVTERYGIPLIATAAGARNIWTRGLRFVFQGEPGSDYLSRPPLEVGRQFGLKKIAVLYTDNSWGHDFNEATTVWARVFGLELVYAQSYPLDVKDLSPALLMARSRGAEILTSSAYLPDAELITRQLKDMGWAPKIVFLATAYDGNFGRDLGRDAEGVTTYSMWAPSLRSYQNREFQEVYRSLFKESPDDKAAIGFAAGQVLEAAINGSRSLDPRVIRDYLATAEIPTVLAGVFKVDVRGLQIGMKVLLMQWQGGKLVIVGPAAFAERKLMFPFPAWDARR